MSKNRWFLLASLLLVCTVAVVVYLTWATRRALVSCHTAAWGRITTEWVTLYVEQHDGQWPRSWDVLLDCESPPVFPNHDPADTIETLKSVVAVDFQVDPRELANQTVEQFDAIRALDGYNVDHREYWEVATLIETLRKYHGPDDL